MSTVFVMLLLQVSTNFLSTRPVLQCLQDMVDVPLADEIVHGKHPKANDYLDKDALQQVSSNTLYTSTVAAWG